MLGKIHLFLITILLKPFYLSNNGIILRVGEFFRQILIFIFKCDLSPAAKIPFSVQFPHYIGIVIGACEMGENCIIRNNVTIGKKNVDQKYLFDQGKKISMQEHRNKYPKLGSQVVIGSNSCIIGPIKIGDNSIIGAGSVVIQDVEANSVYAGVPAKKIKSLEESH